MLRAGNTAIASSTQKGLAPRFRNMSQALSAIAARETRVTPTPARADPDVSGPAAAGGLSALERNHAVAAWVLCALFLVVSAPKLRHLQPNFDEGVYIVQAQLVRRGEVPYVDFFCHQPPLYLYALAGFTPPGPEAIFRGRLLSLLATAACGVAVAHAGRKLAGPVPGLLAQLAFYAAPLQVYGMLALPGAVMVLLSTIGVCAVAFSERAWATTAGGVCLAAAVLVKPLALPVVLAVVLVVAASRSQRRKLPALAASGLGAGLAAWIVLHLASSGAFTEVLALQARRYSGRSGFELMAHYVDFRAAMIERGATTPTLWNLSEHRAAFVRGGLLNGNLLLLLAAAASPLLWRRRLPLHLAGMIAAWLLLPLSFSVFVWEPVWDHYFVQYLPPLSLLAGLTLAALLHARRPLWRAAALPFVAGCLVLGHTQRFAAPNWYDRAAQIGQRARGAAVFSFNPLINAAGGARRVCGLIDPLNVYGEYGVAALAPPGALRRFRITPDQLIACLTPDVRVVIDSYAFWFLEPRVLAHLQATPERLVFFTAADRRRFAALSSSNH
jgi:hypothetical protein